MAIFLSFLSILRLLMKLKALLLPLSLSLVWPKSNLHLSIQFVPLHAGPLGRRRDHVRLFGEMIMPEYSIIFVAFRPFRQATAKRPFS